MARPHAYVIEMETSWHGAAERFTNVFHYVGGAIVDTEQGFRDAAAQIVIKMKEFYGSDVQFKHYTVWGPTDEPDKAQRQIIVDGDLTGAGGIIGGTLLAPDVSVVGSWYIGRNSRGMRNRWLRNQFRVGRLYGANQTNAAYGTAQMGASDLAFYKGKFNDLKTLAVGASAIDRCTPGGVKLPLGTDAKVLPYVSRRQFRRG